jgi:hypothetical protein
MRDKFTLFIAVGKAALMTTIGYSVLGLLGFKAATTPTGQGIFVIAGALLPNGLAAWWIFRELQKQYARRESRAVATAFGIVTPLSLSVAIVLSQIPGAYAEVALGRRFILPAVFIGIAIVTTFLSFASSVFVLRFTRHLEKA